MWAEEGAEFTQHVGGEAARLEPKSYPYSKVWQPKSTKTGCAKALWQEGEMEGCAEVGEVGMLQ